MSVETSFKLRVKEHLNGHRGELVGKSLMNYEPMSKEEQIAQIKGELRAALLCAHKYPKGTSYGTMARHAIRYLGHEIFNLVRSTDKMRDILYEAVGNHSKRGMLLHIADVAWDGIGEGNRRWWC